MWSNTTHSLNFVDCPTGMEFRVDKILGLLIYKYFYCSCQPEDIEKFFEGKYRLEHLAHKFFNFIHEIVFILQKEFEKKIIVKIIKKNKIWRGLRQNCILVFLYWTQTKNKCTKWLFWGYPRYNTHFVRNRFPLNGSKYLILFFYFI